MRGSPLISTPEGAGVWGHFWGQNALQAAVGVTAASLLGPRLAGGSSASTYVDLCGPLYELTVRELVGTQFVIFERVQRRAR